MNSIIPQQKYNEILALLNQVGKEIIVRRHKADFQVFLKPDQSKVTNVDLWANSFIINKMKELFPNDIVIGEESESKFYKKDSERVWYIDPIDGTNNFVKDEPHYFVLVGLAIHGIPTLGFLYKPVENLLIYTAEDKIIAKKDGNPISFSDVNWKNKGSLVLKHTNAEQRQFVAESFNQKKEPYIYDMVSQLGPLFNKSNGYIGFRRSFYWDICAPAAIMSQFGYQHKYYHASGKPALMNDGSIKCRAYFSLPDDAPIEIIDWFAKEASKLEESDD